MKTQPEAALQYGGQCDHYESVLNWSTVLINGHILIEAVLLPCGLSLSVNLMKLHFL